MRKLFILSVVLLAACGGSSAVGNWSGTLGSDSCTMTLGGSDSALIGSGTCGSLVDSINGTLSGSVLSLTLSHSGYEPVLVTGSCDGSTITAVANGSGFQETPLHMTRQ